MNRVNVWLRSGIIISFLILLSAIKLDLNACETFGHDPYVISKDHLGRLLVLWIDQNGEKGLQIALDHNAPKTLSLPGQKCFLPKMGVTKNNDIIVLWTAVDEGKETVSLYLSILPNAGKWSRPLCITEGEEMAFKSDKLMIANENEIDIFWEAYTYYPSTQSPSGLTLKHELRNLRTSINSFGGSPKTIAVLFDGTQL